MRAQWTWVSVVGLMAVLCGCAGTSPDLDGMYSDVQRIQAEAEALKLGEEAAFALEASKSLSSQAQSEKDKEVAAAMLDEAQAAAFASVAASMTQRGAAEADSLHRAAAEAERQWQDTIRMLEQTEKVSEREAKGIERTPPPEPEGIDLPPMPSAVADTSATPVALLDEASRWSEAARKLSLPTADSYGRFLDALHVAQAPKVDDVVRNRETRAAQWTVTEMAHRVQTEALRREGRSQLSRALLIADQRDQALFAMADLERSMKESARTQLEEERARLANREQELYESLKQFEGKFASIRREARGTIMSLSDILFDFNKADLRHEAQLGLAKVSVILQQYPEMRISVEGHTDNVGAEDYNLKLSEKRAQAVYDFLIHEGVGADRLGTQGFGMSQPVAPNETAEGRQKNRRVDLVIRGE